MTSRRGKRLSQRRLDGEGRWVHMRLPTNSGEKIRKEVKLLSGEKLSEETERVTH